jgi:hypothetical protein
MCKVKYIKERERREREGCLPERGRRERERKESPGKRETFLLL